MLHMGGITVEQALVVRQSMIQLGWSADKKSRNVQMQMPGAWAEPGNVFGVAGAMGVIGNNPKNTASCQCPGHCG